MPDKLIVLLAGVAAGPAYAQTAEPPPPAAAVDSAESEEELYAGDLDESVVVVGQRDTRGVIGDIPPEN
ncbi:MAG TPA: hypothetical protein VM326_06905, partial [Sphingomicrobium sp.]|nr:hypothetical protein [Sphingomicrobium sp.]